MAMLTTSEFNGFADRIAKQYSYIKTCFSALSSTAGENYYERIYAAQDPDIELNMLQASYNADSYFAVDVSDTVTRTLTNFTALIPAFQNALKADGTLTNMTWDGFCTANSTQVSDYTNRVYYASKNTYMLANNVWCENSVTMASGTMNGTSLQFTQGASLYKNPSTYSASQLADGNHFAPVPLNFVVDGTNTISNLIVTLSGVGAAGATISEDVSVAGAPGAAIATTKAYVSVTAITLKSGGSNGDSFTVVNTKPRTIAL